MPSLREVQSEMGRGVRGLDAGRVLDAIHDDELAAERRLQIYRNHYYVTLIEALQAAFPVVRQLVGDNFFRQVARRYAALYSPETPCLFEYGARVPLLLESIPEARTLPYLADVARLEWAMNRAYHAPDVPGLSPDALRRVPVQRRSEISLVFHPSVELVSSPYPIARIWRTHQPDAPVEPPIDLAEGRCRLILLREDDAVVWREVGGAEYVFLYALKAGRPIEQALASASATGGTFDLVGLLSMLVSSGALAGLILPPRQTKR
jgi:hypothetical protein